MRDLVPPDPPLAGVQTVLRPFRVSDAAAIAESCRDPDIPRFTMMPEGITEGQARQWIERGLEWWPRGLARFAVTVPPSDGCAGQVGIQFDFAARRAEAFYWFEHPPPDVDPGRTQRRSADRARPGAAAREGRVYMAA